MAMMAFPVGLQLSVELTRLLPLRDAIDSVSASLLNFARELKKSGSDIITEADLASIFGRGKLDDNFEKLFRERVSTSSLLPLHKDSEIILDGRPGPTIRRALQERYYLSTVAQLSLLGWFHERTTLAVTLVECINKRSRMVKDATLDVSFEGVLRFLEVCDAETNRFPWELYVGLIEAKLPKTINLGLYSNDTLMRQFTPRNLLAAMDFLYLTQSLPENRIMVLQDHAGLVPLTIWAHYVLGLSVLVKNTPDGDVSFTHTQSTHANVVITWKSTRQSNLGQGQVYLLDNSDQVIIEPLPKDFFPRTLSINAQERVRLVGMSLEGSCGLGTLELRRAFNSNTTLQDNHPVYEDFVETIVALAISISKCIYHEPFVADTKTKNREVIPLCFESLGHWRIHDVSKVIFRGIETKVESTLQTLKDLQGVAFKEIPFPLSVQGYFKRLPVSDRYTSQTHLDFYVPNNFRTLFSNLVMLVLTLSHVMEVKSCEELPICFDGRSASSNHEHTLRARIMEWNGRDPIVIQDDDWLTQMASMLLGRGYRDLPERIRQEYSVISDFGWSIILSNVGDEDPSDTEPGLLSVQKGVPTSSITQTRKYRILDAPDSIGNNMGVVVVDQKNHYKPGCITNVTDRIDHFASRDQEFWHAMSFTVESAPMAPNMPLAYRQMALSTAYRRLHRALFHSVRPAPCPHGSGPPIATAKLFNGVVTVRGFAWHEGEADSTDNTHGYRICIVLVKGNRWARWLALAGVVGHGDPRNHKPERQVMLKGDDCCEDCAVRTAADIPGKWVVII